MANPSSFCKEPYPDWIRKALEGITPHLFNTESRHLEPVPQPEGRPFLVYTCGPTVYSYAHIGNFRTYVFEDLLRRTLELFGYPVRQVMNLTDVDDKTIRGAIAEGVDLTTYTRPFKKAFFEDLDTLSIQRAAVYPAATEYIPQMISMIERLLQQGIAYQGADQSIYYSIGRFPRYGCLSHLNLDELQLGASERVAHDEYDKENASDFVLWKAYDSERDGEIYWESPFGLGRPGWHVECSAMAIELLGETIDLHIGGVDNIFPHHENEIAQSEAYSGKPFARQWVHSEHLVVDGKKMSKSLGNFYTLRDLINQGCTGRQARYLLLRTHYRAQLNFTFPELEGATHAIERLNTCLHRFQTFPLNEQPAGLEATLIDTVHAFGKALADDLNISAALGVIFDWVRMANGLLDKGDLTSVEQQQAVELFELFNDILGVLHFEEEEKVPQEIRDALQEREEARKKKDWARSDALRDQIVAQGYVIEDTSSGPRAKKA